MLNDFQKSVLTHIVSETLTAKNRFAQGERVIEQIRSVAGYAYALHRDLTIAGLLSDILQTPDTGDAESFANIDRLTRFVQTVQVIAYPSVSLPIPQNPAE